ncbi:MAG TPA: Maf family protein, partial [Dehalococcoidia bacterium]
MPGPELVLASRSPRRRQLLAALGVPFAVIPPPPDEAVPPGLTPEAVAERLALEKGTEVARSLDPRHAVPTVLAADTVVVLDGAVLGKPAGPDDARRMLRALRGRAHRVVTGVAALAGGRREVAHTVTHVRMRAYTDAEIDAYVASGDPLDKAGAYAIQHPGFRRQAGRDRLVRRGRDHGEGDAQGGQELAPPGRT